jgi:squalene-hopene/tetraprenyl-beta-curcumene cyclase
MFSMRIFAVIISVLALSLAGAAERNGKADPDGEPTSLVVDQFAHTFARGAAVAPEDLAPYAKYSADDPAGKFSIERAAQFIDGVAVKWGRKHGCVTCHTNGYYLIVPPKIFKDRSAATEVRDFAEDWINSWDDIGLPRDDVVVAPAAFLTINNMQMNGKLRPATLHALDEAWSLQSAEGHFPNWLKANWPPFEQDDHYGVTLMTIAMGMAPKSYTSIEPARTGVQRLLKYLRNNQSKEIHHRAMMLWAGKYYEELLTANVRRLWIDELLALQKESGGWASGDLGRWRQRAPESGDISMLDPETVERKYPPVITNPNGDGYGTGFVMYVLLQSGVPESNLQIQKGLEWLRNNQQADGKWFTNSLRNKISTSNFLTHTGTTFALKVLAETM